MRYRVFSLSILWQVKRSSISCMFFRVLALARCVYSVWTCTGAVSMLQALSFVRFRRFRCAFLHMLYAHLCCSVLMQALSCAGCLCAYALRCNRHRPLTSAALICFVFRQRAHSQKNSRFLLALASAEPRCVAQPSSQHFTMTASPTGCLIATLCTLPVRDFVDGSSDRILARSVALATRSLRIVRRVFARGFTFQLFARISERIWQRVRAATSTGTTEKPPVQLFQTCYCCT